jgi:hypothetical protein
MASARSSIERLDLFYKQEDRMGMLFRMFAPKPMKKMRRAAHPVSLLTPRPVRKAKARARDIANPVRGVKRAGKRKAVRSVRGSKWF